MTIRLDYSWWCIENSEPSCTEDQRQVEQLDPTPGDLAITEDDFRALGVNGYQQIVPTAQRHTSVPLTPTPYILMSLGGETLLVTEPASCDWEQRPWRREYTTDGHFRQWIFVNGESGRNETIFPNTSGYRIYDTTPPSYEPSDGNHPADTSFFSGKVADDRIEISLRGAPIGDTEDPCNDPSSVHVTFLADGVLYAGSRREPTVTIPLDTKELSIRVSDKAGNALEYNYSKIIVGDKAFFIRSAPDQARQQSEFQSYVRSLINMGYNLNFTDEIVDNPLEYLITNYGENLLTPPESDNENRISLPIFSLRKFDAVDGTTLYSATRVTDWVSGTDVVLEGFRVESEDADTLTVLQDMWRDFTVSAKLNAYNGNEAILSAISASETEIQIQSFIVPSRERRAIPRSFLNAEFQFLVRPRAVPGQTNFPIRLTRTGRDLLRNPILISGKIESISIRVPSSSEIESAQDEVVDNWGNKITFDRDTATFTIKPDYVYYGDTASIYLDFSSFGLADIQRLIDIGEEPAVGKIGTDSAYNLYASTLEQPRQFFNILDEIEAAEWDFGFRPGGMIKGIRISPPPISGWLGSMDTGNMVVKIFDESILDNYFVVGYHEVVHAADHEFSISADSRFKQFFQQMSSENPAFLEWVTSHNFLPAGRGGTYADEKEFLAELLSTSLHPNLQARLAQSRPGFVTAYVEALQIVEHILQERRDDGKIGGDAPIFEKIRAMIATAESVSYEEPVQFEQWTPPGRRIAGEGGTEDFASLLPHPGVREEEHFFIGPTIGFLSASHANDYSQEGETRGLVEAKAHFEFGLPEDASAQFIGHVYGAVGAAFGETSDWLWWTGETGFSFGFGVLPHLSAQIPAGYQLKYNPFDGSIDNGFRSGILLEWGGFSDVIRALHFECRVTYFPATNSLWLGLGLGIPFFLF